MLALARRPSRESYETRKLAPWVAIHAGDERTSTCRLLDAEAMSLTRIEAAANDLPPAANDRPAASAGGRAA